MGVLLRSAVETPDPNLARSPVRRRRGGSDTRLCEEFGIPAAIFGESWVIAARSHEVKSIHVLKPFWGITQRKESRHSTHHRGNKTEEKESRGEHEWTLPHGRRVGDPGGPAFWGCKFP